MISFKDFKRNNFPTVGVEQEFHLIDPVSADLVAVMPQVWAAHASEVRDVVSPELKDCIIERQTYAHRRIADLRVDIMTGRREMAEACRRVGVRFVAAGTHPFADWRRMPYVDSAHYQWVRQQTGYISDRMLAFGLHVHVGMKNSDAAMYAIHQFRPWLYPLLAMSANSPFFEGVDTGLASTRLHLFSSMPRTGLPPDVLTLQELEEIYNRLQVAGDVAMPGDLWYALRPQPMLGTVEVRICDLPTDYERVCVLAAIVQAAMAFHQECFFAGIPPANFHLWYLEQNSWKAMRYGLDAVIVNPETSEIVTMRQYARGLLQQLTATARDLGTSAELAAAFDILNQGNEASWQRRRYQELGGDLRQLELDLAARSEVGEEGRRLRGED